MKIDNFKVGIDGTFIIAEIGNNHNGDFDRAIYMIDQVRKLDINAVKFQMRNLNEVYTKKSLNYSGEDLSVEYTIDLLKKFELPTIDHEKIKNYCFEKKITYLCTPWDKVSLSILEKFKVPAYKVSSADFTNLLLIDSIIKTKKPLILSTGMSNEEEIKIVTKFLNKHNASFALLHCNSTYPAPYHDVNLAWMDKLKEYSRFVGYSGHERGFYVSLASVGRGAKILERHFTLDRNMEGPDHAASLELNDFSKLVDGVRQIDQAIGNEKIRFISQGEMINKENLGKSLVSKKKLSKGIILSKKHIDIKSPGQGLSVLYFDKLIGKKLKRDMSKDDFFFKSDLKPNLKLKKFFKFNLSWGIPVRYHDFKLFKSLCSPNLWEFHLSYSDMKLNLNKFFDGTYKENFLVHAPELFKNSMLMDLASEDDAIRRQSINETQNVIEITKKLNSFFPNTNKPKIICNVGGFSKDRKLTKKEKLIKYEILFESLELISRNEVEILPQTMAPFPWHFGGQRYQNLFVEDNEIVHYCKKFNLNICFDISHSWLACNFLNKDFLKFCKKIAPFTKHIHIADAFGLNGEGLQINDGEINFKKLSEIFLNDFNQASFIPEIWQGHKNFGEGFWIALNRLEGKL